MESELEQTPTRDDDCIIIQDLYMKGDDVQKLSVIQSLPQLLQTDNHATITRIIPKIQQELPNSSSEFHIATSQMFKLLIEMAVPINLINPVIQGIESKDPVVADAWMETLLAVIPSLKDNVVKKEILNCAFAKAQINKETYFRVASCKMLGQISMHPGLTAFEVKKDILPLAQGLCQDCFYEVRAAMCKELPRVAHGLSNLGETVIKSTLLPSVVELSSDENMSVRVAAIDSVAEIIPFLSSETIAGTIIPLVKKFCMQTKKQGDLTFPSLARVYGKLIKYLQGSLSKEDAIWFLEFYKSLCQKGLTAIPEDLEYDIHLGVICREFCAYNLPAMAAMVISEIPSHLNMWYDVFIVLSADSCYIIRKTVAAGFHELVGLLGDQNKILKGDFVRLLRDEAEEVLNSLVPNMGVNLEHFCDSKVLSRDTAIQATLEIGRAILKCQGEVFKTNNWRLKMSFLAQLEHLPNVMPSDFIHQHFTPTVLNLTLEAHARPVRSQAARTVLIFLRYNVKENHRRWIRENIITNLCHAKSCYTRHIFIKTCMHAFEIFSMKYFKEYFYLSLLSLAEDPVSTVRLCVVRLCPTLKHMLILPIDRSLQVKLETILMKIEMNELDRDVLYTLKCKLKEMRSAQLNKQEALIEEKRRVEEEEKIHGGKLPPRTGGGASEAVAPNQDAAKSNPIISASKTSLGIKSRRSNVPLNNMSFLGQHFYIDAGVSLPSKVTQIKNEDTQKVLNLPKPIEIEQEKVISAENINLDALSERDLKELETVTTNITDDVKVNLQKINLSKETKEPAEVKKRIKRYSCVFNAEQQKEATNKEILKRRSLNIGPSDVSKIPVCFKTGKKIGEMTKTKSASTQSLNNYSRNESKIAVRKRDIPNASENRKEVKENLPMRVTSVPNKSGDVGNSGAKVSGLPVLIRRTQSDARR